MTGGLSLDDLRHPLEEVAPVDGLEVRPSDPLGIGYGAERPNGALGAIAPRRWLVAGAAADVDLTHALVTVRVRRTLLAAGVTIPVEADALPTGSLTMTSLGGLPAILHAVGTDHIDVHLPRSMVRSAWQWLADAAAPPQAPGNHSG